jgi:hypothetical protein
MSKKKMSNKKQGEDQLQEQAKTVTATSPATDPIRQATPPAGDFQILPDDFDQSVLDQSDEGSPSNFHRKLNPWTGRVDTVLFLGSLQSILSHVIWADREKETFACGPDCALCAAGEKSVPLLIAPVYLTDDDMGATLILPGYDSKRLKAIPGLRELKGICDTVGAENFFRTPIEITVEEARTGIQHLVIEADKANGRIFTHRPQDPEYVAACEMRKKLGDQPLLRMFSLDLDGKLFPKQAKRIRRKLGVAE